MKKIQGEKKINPLPSGVRFSIFDKSKNKNNFLKSDVSGPHNQVKGDSPQFRINQHKGA
ncbi:MAG: hypothetical protein UR29_C0009G0025 [Candidatus Woesebacteria bacterium GW2011_GWC2_33_12]|uniref:Uncharacterized protein n=1 Tax=Candidatus Woesebacteria bacterium GW2011_GWB1_33_22 TaxID=1618566 RepID=A0A0G0CP88_9BACT|nr:MAG: hypothetical protein UR29_C0009G0025 [Candidatus Woesebacteria bacterium GW2011_GWC2_33_12]KKP42449.1 MAG: hypothetical protein UR33_C0002G0025 [Candidatus Woesebacteria bacterium GW2011_GWA2_33_20]KKP45192.1 MAG: hypothetical protein UR35_C0002G0025 [Candidatus Woesebacteria bacterium GW2011_GWB1_33_22]KKP46191.1 MAG: hypothetical protein UR37_C0011G0025 [Microgenomates group bacterium GW2011_GWC1_33_28]KKP50861.1 MAG: hypothetical protein UR41_C0002G0025 [Candidatus Woesebacteria bact